MYLIDTNIILEVLLGQEKKEACKKFMIDYAGEISISDYSIFSIGNLLFHKNSSDLFLIILKEIKDNLNIKSLINFKLDNVVKPYKNFKLDFDDAYQYQVAKEYGLTLVTLDNHFKKVTGIKTLFL